MHRHARLNIAAAIVSAPTTSPVNGQNFGATGALPARR